MSTDTLARPDARRPGSQPVSLRLGPVSWQVPIRAGMVALGGLIVAAILFVLDLGLGDYPIAPTDVVITLLGGGTPAQSFIINGLRLPQASVAVLVGAALGLSGALTQTFARNPLASPDILGITNGASAGAVSVIILAGTAGYGGGIVSGLLQTVGVPVAAFVGGIGTAALLYVLAWRGGVDGGRLVLIGIGIGAFMTAIVSWLLATAQIEDAASAAIWLNGSLNGRGWEQALPVAASLLVFVPASLILIRSLNAMQLGDDSARGLGVRLQTTQLLMLVCAVGLAAVAVSAVGPLNFVAFVVPQIALRLTGGSRPPMLAAMTFGAALVLGADLISRVVIPLGLPAGMITAVLGAPYLLWLLLRSNRRISA